MSLSCRVALVALEPEPKPIVVLALFGAIVRVPEPPLTLPPNAKASVTNVRLWVPTAIVLAVVMLDAVKVTSLPKVTAPL